MKIKAIAKHPIHIQSACYDFEGCGGVTIISDIQAGQEFSVHKQKKYYFLSRKHLGVVLRFTEKSLSENFDIKEPKDNG